LHDHPCAHAAPLRYRRLAPWLVAKVNRLLVSQFWRGIDVAPCLVHPELTCVATYRRLVVGCALLSPEGYLSYVAVAPQWRGYGIGSRLVFLALEQLDRSVDVTLHVSPTNTGAVVMYQRLGFKIDKWLVGFYRGYVVQEPGSSETACLMRLRRAHSTTLKKCVN
jgi:ribosomal protein S18 acetylase RimI-like enzyme